MLVEVGISFDQSVGSDRELKFAVFKNSAIISNSEIIRNTVSGNKAYVTINAYVDLATNDFIELFAINLGASGDINFYTINFHSLGVPG